MDRSPATGAVQGSAVLAAQAEPVGRAETGTTPRHFKADLAAVPATEATAVQADAGVLLAQEVWHRTALRGWIPMEGTADQAEMQGYRAPVVTEQLGLHLRPMAAQAAQAATPATQVTVAPVALVTGPVPRVRLASTVPLWSRAATAEQVEMDTPIRMAQGVTAELVVPVEQWAMADQVVRVVRQLLLLSQPMQ